MDLLNLVSLVDAVEFIDLVELESFHNLWWFYVNKSADYVGIWETTYKSICSLYDANFPLNNQADHNEIICGFYEDW